MGKRQKESSAMEDFASNKIANLRIQSNLNAVQTQVNAAARKNFINLSVVAVDKLDIRLIELEISLMQGMPRLEFIGFSGAAVNDARLRITAAIKNAGYKMPGKRITISSGLHERLDYHGSLDLPIIAGILNVSGQIMLDRDLIYLGMVSINGELVTFSQAMACLAFIKRESLSVLCGNFVRELSITPLPDVCLIKNISDLRSKAMHEQLKQVPLILSTRVPAGEKVAVLPGQEQALRALQIAVVGRHPLCFMGTPGSGKSELLRLAPYMMPPLSEKEQLNLLIMNSMTEKEDVNWQLVAQPPLQTMFPSMKKSEILGAQGKHFGSWNLSAYGVFLIEEINAMSTAQISLIQELLDRQEMNMNEDYNAERDVRYRLVLASGNPCNCGRYFERDGSCVCLAGDVFRHLNKLHAAFRERFDMWLRLRCPKPEDQRGSISREKTLDLSVIRSALTRSKLFRESRRAKRNELNVQIRKNMQNSIYDDFALLPEALAFAEGVAERRRLSLRLYRKTLELARSIADLELAEFVKAEHVLEASQYIITDFKDL